MAVMDTGPMRFGAETLELLRAAESRVMRLIDHRR
jgi:hypothetical protein